MSNYPKNRLPRDPSRKCSITECGKLAQSRGWCQTHYIRWRKWGDPLVCKEPVNEPLDWLKEQIATRERGDECWEWPFSRTQRQGYARCHVEGKEFRAHSVALELAGFPKPEPPLDSALHSCDNPPCVNPAHLRWGTDADNAKDREERNRGRRGEAHHNSKLTEAQVLAIYSDPRPYSQIAKSYGIAAGHVGVIKTNRGWQWLTQGERYIPKPKKPAKPRLEAGE